MYDFFKNIAVANGWGFEYSRADYQNLNEDIEAGKVYLFLDPIQTESKFTETGNETLTYTGKLMLLLSSDVDEEYIDKYNDYIKPLFKFNLQAIKDELACDDYQINSFKSTEIINLFDANLDGILINYTITQLD
jgi:hypothetical protein